MAIKIGITAISAHAIILNIFAVFADETICEALVTKEFWPLPVAFANFIPKLISCKTA